MPANEIHVNDVGTKILVTVQDGTSAVDVSGATATNAKQIIIKKPSGTKLEKEAVFNSDGTDGKIYHNSILGDFDEAGTYKIQGKVVISDGTFYTDIQSFKVHRNL
jgi:hypothetical protein